MKKTRDYSKFKFHDSNRKVDRSHLNHIVQAISINDLLSHYPILVSSDGYVLDGQHRLKAAEALGKEIWYTETDQPFSQDLVTSINNSSRSWRFLNYIESCSTENERLKYLLEQCAKHNIQPSSLMNMMLITRTSGRGRTLALKNFRASNEEIDRAVYLYEKITGLEKIYKIRFRTKDVRNAIYAFFCKRPPNTAFEEHFFKHGFDEFPMHVIHAIDQLESLEKRFN